MRDSRDTEEYSRDQRQLEDETEDRSDPYLQYEPKSRSPEDPQALAQWFEQVRENTHSRDLETEKALHAYQSISTVINYKYGEEKPIDLHDSPEGSLLAIGHSAAHRILEYGETPPEMNERVKDWNQALAAFAFTLTPEESQPFWQAIQEHGAHYSKPVFTPEE